MTVRAPKAIGRLLKLLIAELPRGDDFQCRIISNAGALH
jgi:hypothetical protein